MIAWLKRIPRSPLGVAVRGWACGAAIFSLISLTILHRLWPAVSWLLISFCLAIIGGGYGPHPPKDEAR